MKIYMWSRDISGYPSEIRHHMVRLRHDSPEAASDFVNKANEEMAKYTTNRLSWYMETVLELNETWCVTDLGANKDEHDNLGTYYYDSDDLTHPYKFEELAPSEINANADAAAELLVTAWICYDKCYTLNYQIPYRETGPNCITFCMSLLQAVGFSYDYLKPISDRIGFGFNAGADLLIHTTFFNELSDLNLSLDGSQLHVFPVTVSGMIYKTANLCANNCSTIKIPCFMTTFASPGLICTEGVSLNASHSSTIETQILISNRDMTLIAYDKSTVNIAIEAHALNNGTLNVEESSTINITQNLKCSNISIHEDVASTVTIGGLLDCSGVSDFFVGDASTATVSSHNAVHAQLHAFGASTITLRNCGGLASLDGLVESSSTIFTYNYHGSGSIHEDCGTWIH